MGVPGIMDYKGSAINECSLINKSVERVSRLQGLQQSTVQTTVHPPNFGDKTKKKEQGRNRNKRNVIWSKLTTASEQQPQRQHGSWPTWFARSSGKSAVQTKPHTAGLEDTRGDPATQPRRSLQRPSKICRRCRRWQ